MIWRSRFVHCVPVRISPVAVRSRLSFGIGILVDMVRSMLITYHVLEYGVPYKGLSEDYFHRQRSRAAYAKQFPSCRTGFGHKVAFEPLPQASRAGRPIA